MAGIVISSLSTIYVQVPIQAVVAGKPYDPTGDTVQMAFPTGTANPQSWNAASWTTGPGTDSWLAQCLVGPGAGGVDLATGTYGIWVQITDHPEIPVLNAGTLVIE